GEDLLPEGLPPTVAGLARAGVAPVLDFSEREEDSDLGLDRVEFDAARSSALTVEFAIPSAAPARLELFDISGRALVSREVGSFGAGRHSLSLNTGHTLPPGLYFVRLSQGRKSDVKRVAVLD